MRSSLPLFPPAIYAHMSQTGVSDEAMYLRQSWESFFDTMVNTIALGTQYRLIQASLADLARDVARANWDAHGASAVDTNSLAYAKRVAHFLPVTRPSPEVSIDPDGEVAFDWRAEPTGTLSFSVGPDGALRYASVRRGSENFGREAWRDGLPESVAELLQRFIVRESTT